MKFKVRVYPKGGPPRVFSGGSDVLGAYLEIAPSRREGAETIPAQRFPLDKKLMRRLPEGSDADYEYLCDVEPRAIVPSRRY